MYRRDLILAEIQKLGQVLARIMGLKLEGRLEEADLLLLESLSKDFGITEENLFMANGDEFEAILTELAHPAEKLDMLSQFLYSAFSATEFSERNDVLAEKLQRIYQILEQKHHIVSMTNLDRQKKISQYLNS